VKEPIESINFKKVLFATDLGLTDREAFGAFLSFLKEFKTNEVHILTIDTPGFITQPRALVKELQKDFKAMAKAFNCTVHFTRSFTVEEGIRNYSEELGVSLIGISNLKRHPIKRIFSGSNVEMLANHSIIPVLSIDGELPTENP
jgi:nucleotide-binding universal stress UspA family protein